MSVLPAVKLWSMQPVISLDILEKEGVYRTDNSRAWEYEELPNNPWHPVHPAYEWMAMQLFRKTGTRPKYNRYPVWAWEQWRGIRKKRPDLRSLRFAAQPGDYVLYELDIPEKDILLSDFDLWHYPLNLWYLTTDEGMQKKWDLETDDIQWAWSDHRFRDRITDSWDLIFDTVTFYKDITHPPELRCIQAVFWEIRPEYIVSTKKFSCTYDPLK